MNWGVRKYLDFRIAVSGHALHIIVNQIHHNESKNRSRVNNRRFPVHELIKFFIILAFLVISESSVRSKKVLCGRSSQWKLSKKLEKRLVFSRFWNWFKPRFNHCIKFTKPLQFSERPCSGNPRHVWNDWKQVKQVFILIISDKRPTIFRKFNSSHCWHVRLRRQFFQRSTGFVTNNKHSENIGKRHDGLCYER